MNARARWEKHKDRINAARRKVPDPRIAKREQRLCEVLEEVDLARFALIDYKRVRNAVIGMRSDNVGAQRELDLGVAKGLPETDGYLYWEPRTSPSP